jgi:hypothetical protein
MVSDLREQIQEEIDSTKREIEKHKLLAKKKMGHPHALEDVTHRLRELHVRLEELEENLRRGPNH